jgi:hypothetical protein
MFLICLNDKLLEILVYCKLGKMTKIRPILSPSHCCSCCSIEGLKVYQRHLWIILEQSESCFAVEVEPKQQLHVDYTVRL